MPALPPDLGERVVDALRRRAARWARGREARRASEVRREPLQLRSTVGFQIDAHVHRPADATGPLPAVLMCPGEVDPGSVFDTDRAPVTADEVARLGCVALHFDPAGRGGSWGEEDQGGPEHQDDVATALRYLAGRPDVDPARMGILAVAHGIAMAVGGAVAADTPVAWLLDWEGPGDRETLTAGGTREGPAMGHALDDDAWWAPREAVRAVGRLPCPYVRLQAGRDHSQPGEVRHAQRMVHAAAEGTLPWFQINDHPRGEVPPRPVWLPNGPLAANRAILRKIGTLVERA